MTKRLEWFATLLACAGMAVVSSGCATCAPREIPPPCVSRCGMLLEDEGNGSMSCTVLQEAEDSVLSAADELKGHDHRFEKTYACGQLFGWQLHLYEEVISIDLSVSNLPFTGMTDCKSKEMHLNANASWRKGSYPHEIFHALQNCNPPKDWTTSDPLTHPGVGHKGWHDHGVTDIIDDFRAGRR